LRIATFPESVVEDATLALLGALGYAMGRGADITAGEPSAEHSDPNYCDVLLEGRLRQALARLNPDLPPETLKDAFRELTRAEAPSLPERNRATHRMLADGVTVAYWRKYELHALRDGRESMSYAELLPARRKLMAGILRRGFETL
jgi:type I restriction enzyme R subunit